MTRKRTTKQPEPKKEGRPRKEIDPRDLARLPQLAACLNEQQLADFLGMSETTLRQRMKDDPAVSEAYKKGKAQAIASVAAGLLKMCQGNKPNLTAMIFYLKTQARWKERVGLEHTGEDGAELPEAIIVRYVDPPRRRDRG